MRRIRLIAIGLSVLLLASSGILYYLYFTPVDKFYWEVEVDDTHQYRVRSWGGAGGGVIDFHEVEYILGLNGTTITVAIESLPSFDDVIDANSFFTNIVLQDKVKCTHANGTELSGAVGLEITEAISGCILPLGSWNALDNLFPNENHGWNPDTESLATILYEDRFYISYSWSGTFDDSGGWYGNVTLADGVPSQIRWGYFHSIGVYIELTLVEL